MRWASNGLTGIMPGCLVLVVMIEDSAPSGFGAKEDFLLAV